MASGMWGEGENMGGRLRRQREEGVKATYLRADERALGDDTKDTDQLVDAVRGQLPGGHLVASKVPLEADMDLVPLGHQLGEIAVVAGALLDRVFEGGKGLSWMLEDALHGEGKKNS